MTNRTKLYQRMAQREKVAITKSAEDVQKLAQSRQETEEQKEKLEALISEKRNNISTASNKYQLQTNHWFSKELSDQLEITQNKSELLDRELGRTRTAMAQQEHKLSMLQDKHSDAVRAAQNDRDEKMASAQISTRRR